MAIKRPENDDEIIIDTGAGRNLKRTMSNLINPRQSNSRIIWGDGSCSGTTLEADLPGKQMSPFLVTPKCSKTLISVGAETDGKETAHAFFDKHCFEITGLQIFKNKNNKLDARFVEDHPRKVSYIGSKACAGDVYKAPSLSVFNNNEDGSWRFSDYKNGVNNIVAGVNSKTKTPVHAKSAIDAIFAGYTEIQRDLLFRDANREDFVLACEYTSDNLNANQRRTALQLLRIHNRFGHASRLAMRCILQQSHIKSERELARHIDLMPLCNHCLNGKNKKGAKNKQKAATPPDPIKFLQKVVTDLSGKRNVMSTDGFWYSKFIICIETGYTWVRFLKKPSEAKQTFEEWLREIPKQHITHAVKTVRHDGGRADFGNTNFGKMLAKYDITNETTTGASTGNGKVERRIGIATTDSMTCMLWCHGPRGWWSHSTKYSVINRNLLPSTTNPGHMSPYEYAYNRKPDYSMLVPFGCLAFVVVDNKDMNGKTNYRKASRTCAMIGYTLKTDGHPLGYILYDCELGTTIRRPGNLVTFNPDMPALVYIAETTAKRPVDLYEDAIVAKFFPSQNNDGEQVLHWGKMVQHRIDTDGELLFLIHYEDGDSEEFNVAEMMIHNKLASSHMHERKGKGKVCVWGAPKIRKKKKLSQLLGHAKSIADNSKDATHPLKATVKLSNSTTPNPEKVKSACEIKTTAKCETSIDTSGSLRRSHRKRRKPDRLNANNACLHKQRRVTWADLLNPRVANCKTSSSLPADSPVKVQNIVTNLLLINQGKQQPFRNCRHKLNGKQRKHVTAAIALGGSIFNCSDEQARKRLQLKQEWAFTIACGAMVEPIPSNVPEIEVTPETLASSIPLPKSYQEAITGPYRKYWKEAIRVELENLLSRKVWREEPLPKGSVPVPGRYVWKVKRADNGTIAKWKVRYIIQGFRQRKGIDYEKTFASVANIVTIRAMLAIACEMDWDIHQMDVKAAYLCSKLEPSVRMYIKCPKGYKLEPGMAARLLMGLYGTKQGGALWSQLRTKTMKKLNFTQSLADPSFYIRCEGDECCMVSTIVDDFVITGTSAAVAKFKKEIASEWEMTDEGILFWCLNLRVTRDKNNGLLKIDQEQYVDEILRRFSMEDCNPRATPMDQSPILFSDMCPVREKKDNYEETFPYASAIGSLLYLRLTRPDLLVAISILAKFMKNPQKPHWQAVKAIFRYIKGSKSRGLLYKRTITDKSGPWKLVMWVDSDYAMDPDTRRSRAGYLGYLNKNLITFNSQLQRGQHLEKKYPGLYVPPTPMDGEPIPSMATATCGAEYMALGLAVKELIWLYMLLKTMNINVERPCIVYEDNRSCIKVAENASAMRRSKHIDIRHHFLREHVENGTIVIKPVSTKEQLADVMTKILGKYEFLRFRDIITSDIKL